MLPGLVLTVGLLAQSLASLVPATPPNTHARRFVNIGDTIVESATAKPVAPEGVCAPVAPVPPPTIVERRVIVQAPPAGMSDATPDEAQRIDSDLAGLPFLPVGVAPFSPRFHSHPHGAPRAPTSVRSPSTVLLPPFPTVLLPPGSAGR